MHRPAGAGDRADPRSDVNREPGQIILNEPDLTSVHARSDLNAEDLARIDDRLSAANRAGGTVEGGHEAIAQRLDLPAAPTSELLTHRFVVAIQQLTPLSVA